MAQAQIFENIENMFLGHTSRLLCPSVLSPGVAPGNVVQCFILDAFCRLFPHSRAASSK